jgi:hypothetical protein
MPFTHASDSLLSNALTELSSLRWLWFADPEHRAPPHSPGFDWAAAISGPLTVSSTLQLATLKLEPPLMFASCPRCFRRPQSYHWSSYTARRWQTPSGWSSSSASTSPPWSSEILPPSWWPSPPPPPLFHTKAVGTGPAVPGALASRWQAWWPRSAASGRVERLGLLWSFLASGLGRLDEVMGRIWPGTVCRFFLSFFDFVIRLEFHRNSLKLPNFEEMHRKLIKCELNFFIIFLSRSMQ